MRHRKGVAKLGKPTDQRMALLRSLVIALFTHNKIKTTDVRAKAASKVAEKLITHAKTGGVHSIRLALKMVPDKEIVKHVFKNVAPKYQDKKGGYTRITKLGFRQGDAAPVSLLELV